MTSVHRARNAAASWLRFEVHPSDQIRIMDRIEADGEELVGIYHSHTESEAKPSQTDINLAANWPGLHWLICSLENHDSPVVRAFLDRRQRGRGGGSRRRLIARSPAAAVASPTRRGSGSAASAGCC